MTPTTTTAAALAAGTFAGAAAATIAVRTLYRGRFARADRMASAIRAADRADNRREFAALLNQPLADVAAIARRVHAEDNQ